jgi:ascorbate-specific PTS system EIIC-type component UlaA
MSYLRSSKSSSLPPVRFFIVESDLQLCDSLWLIVNTWSPVMYQAMDSDFFSSSLYWIVGVIVINFWLINLIIAVVVNTFINIRGETKKSAFGADE